MNANAMTTVMRLLSKDVLKANLAKAGLYVLAYELLKNSIIERIREFFSFNGRSPDASYNVKVLSKDRNLLKASCLWLEEMGAITQSDTAAVFAFRDHRNKIAHELPNILLNPDVQVDSTKLLGLYELLCKIDRWWITEVEIPTNPDFDGQTIVAADVRSGSMEFVCHLIRVVYDLDQVNIGECQSHD